MGKIRQVTLGDEAEEQEQKRKAEARRETKKAKKAKPAAETDETPVGAEQPEETGKPEKKQKVKKQAVARVRGKKYTEALKIVDRSKLYSLDEAIRLVKAGSFTKFDGTVELHLNLNINALGGKKDYRTSVSLPHGTGKQVKVVVADDAVIAEITAGKINFDVLVARPAMMPKLAKVARILGPRGLMPNPKTGTVTEDVDKRVKELSQGQVNIKTEPENPIIHMAIGKVSFDDQKISENVKTVFSTVGKGKIAKATLSATMAPGVKLDIASI